MISPIIHEKLMNEDIAYVKNVARHNIARRDRLIQALLSCVDTKTACSILSNHEKEMKFGSPIELQAEDFI